MCNFIIISNHFSGYAENSQEITLLQIQDGCLGCSYFLSLAHTFTQYCFLRSYHVTNSTGARTIKTNHLSFLSTTPLSGGNTESWQYEVTANVTLGMLHSTGAEVGRMTMNGLKGCNKAGPEHSRKPMPL